MSTMQEATLSPRCQNQAKGLDAPSIQRQLIATDHLQFCIARYERVCKEHALLLSRGGANTPEYRAICREADQTENWAGICVCDARDKLMRANR